MATKITVALEDDLDGGPANETVRFGLGSAQYEIDLNKKNARAFRRKLAPFVEHARKAGPGQRRGPARTASSRQHSGDIRAWAKAKGLRSATAAASPPALQTSTKPPRKDPYERPVTAAANQSAQMAPGPGQPVNGAGHFRLPAHARIGDVAWEACLCAHRPMLTDRQLGAAWLVWSSPPGEGSVDAANERPGPRWLDPARPGAPYGAIEDVLAITETVSPWGGPDGLGSTGLPGYPPAAGQLPAATRPDSTHHARVLLPAPPAWRYSPARRSPPLQEKRRPGHATPGERRRRPRRPPSGVGLPLAGHLAGRDVQPVPEVLVGDS